MRSFLQIIAEKYLSEFPNGLRDICFVFPSRRAAIFFRKYLGQGSKEPVLSPDLLTISDLYAKLSDLKVSDRIELIYLMFTCFQQLDTNGSLTFDDFVQWGDILLNDFSDIDKYMVDAGALLANVKDLNALSGIDYLTERQREAIKHFWNVTINAKRGEMREAFLSFWDLLLPLYNNFKALLQSQGKAYDGMIYRNVAEKIATDGGCFEALEKYRRIVFIGHNALCSAEKVLFNHIRDRYDGDFYWDFYSDELKDTINKASLFISDFVNEYPSKYKLDFTVAGKPTVETYSVASAVGETKLVSQILQTIESDQLENSAIVLPDESLLIPMLNSIPKHIGEINVTMGYGIANSAFSTFMKILAGLQLRKKERKGKQFFYHKDVEALLNHPFILTLKRDAAEHWLGKILKENMVYCQYEGSDSLLSLIFSPMLTTDEICQWQLQVIDMIAPNVDILEKEFAAGFYTAINRIRNLQIKMEPKTYFAFLRQLSLRIKVPFKGEPLHGLQIMGPLETRALDFENVIILSVNEGVYPATSHLESFIPYNLRVGYGLPVQEYLDAVSSYHFYRLIYRAKNVKLIYDSRTGGVQSTESSRFIKQLKYHYHYPIVEKICTYDSSVEKDDAESIEKGREVIEKLAAKFAYKQEKRSYLSATTLNTYLTCPAQFYYSKVMGIQDEQEVSEDMEANLFGTIFHETMERIYKPLSGMEVSKHTITPTKIREIVEVVMRKECHLDNEPISGKMLISLNLLCKMVECTIKADNDALPFRHLVSEQPLRMEMELEDRCLERVQLGGTIDRMDLVEGYKLIIADYKTGSAKNVEFSGKNGYEAAVGQLFCMGSKHMNYKIPFQMLFYATLASHNEAYSGYEKRFKVYQLKSIFNENPVVTDCPQEVLEMYGDMLKSLVDEIFNPEVPFEYKPDKNVCCYCPANLICKKSLL